MATAEQEREYVAQLEGRSIESVKRSLVQNEIPPAFVFPVSQWVSDKEREAERKRDVSATEASDLAREANNLARSANESALEANALAREANSIARDASASASRTATAARTSNMIATMALIAAVVAIAISIIGLFLRG